MDGQEVITLLTNALVVNKGASSVTVTAHTNGSLSVSATYGPLRDDSIETEAELTRLRTIEALTAKIVKLLNEGQVDYDLVTQLRALLNV